MSKNTNILTIDAVAEDLLRIILNNGGVTKRFALDDLGITDAQFKHSLKRLRAKGFAVPFSRRTSRYTVRMAEGIGAVEQEVVSEIDRLGLTEDEISNILSTLRSKRAHAYAPKMVNISDENFKFGLISDLHIGHKMFRRDVLDHAIDNFRKQDVDFVLNCGDTLEGMSDRKGHMFELDNIGVSDRAHGLGMGAQKRLFEEYFKPFVDYDIRVMSIEADASHTSWGRVKSNQGEDIGPELEKYCKAYDFIGYLEQDVVTRTGLRMRLRHPGRGSAQTYSHMLQKYIKDLSGGDKPNFVFNGHFHKIAHVFQRNIIGYEAGCMQDQTSFMKKIPTPAHVAYQIFTVYPDGNSVSRFLREMVPFYD